MEWTFEYDWHPRDPMERVDKFVNGAAIPVGYLIDRCRLSCDGALSLRFVDCIPFRRR